MSMPLAARVSAPLFVVLLISFAAVSASAQSRPTSAIAGRVVDDASAGPLPGALVTVDGTTRSTTTDRDGVFRLEGCPPGLKRWSCRTWAARP
jgi:TonB-dependent starch-binding outer membrane protein SusC